MKVEVDNTRVVVTMPSGYDFQVVFTTPALAEHHAAKIRKRYGLDQECAA